MEIFIQVFIGVILLWEGIRDFFSRKISVAGVLVIGFLGVILQLCYDDFNWLGIVGGALIGAGLLLISGITGEAIGYGDGLVVIATGIALGLRRNILMLCIAFVLCAVASVMLLIFRKANKKTVLPFVSFLFPAYVLVCMS